MPQEPQLAHRVIGNPALPYKTNTSPINADGQYILGSLDVLTSMAGIAERRPGFASYVESGGPTSFNNLQRLFAWERFDGTFYVMACDILPGNFAAVYKYAVGVDTAFIQIWSSSGNTPYDFVVSNNTVYFSNGIDAKKWTPDAPTLNGVSNWGIATPQPTASAGPNSPTLGNNLVYSGGSFPWTIPGGWPVPAATNSVTGGPRTPPQIWLYGISDKLVATGYGFALTAGVTVLGVQVDLLGSISKVIANLNTFDTVYAQLMYGGVPIGTEQGIQFNSSSATLPTFGGPNDTWGTTSLTASMVNSGSFGVSIWHIARNGSTTQNMSWTLSVDDAQLTIFEQGAPVVTVSGAAGAMTATAGYQYVYCYYNAFTGHLSSPCLPSNSTGVFTNKASVSIPVVASTDPQVTNIKVFRTTDGGGGPGGYFELPNSPFANANATVTDSAADEELNVNSIAPTPTFNDPPTPGLQPAYFSGRIWMIDGTTKNKVWFSGLEEINQGVPEECWPSGNAGNFWNFDEPVIGQGVSGQGDNQSLVLLCGGRFYGITGNTLDTFRRFRISERRGTRSLASVTGLGGMLGWFDSSNQIWATDGSSLNEISADIRPDLVGISPALTSMTFHVSGRQHWCVFGVAMSNAIQLPTVAALATNTGVGAWANKNNILVDDGSYATSLVPGAGAGDYLDALAFQFDQRLTRVPVVGIEVAVKGIQDSAFLLDTLQLQLLRNGQPVGDIKSFSLPLAPIGYITMGGNSDVWGAAWSYPEVVNANFGVRMWGFSGTGAAVTFSVDAVQMVIYYGGTFVYDMDTNQWMPPWTFAPQYLSSGEISAGQYVLMAATRNQAVVLNPIRFNDQGDAYQPVLRTNLMSVVPDYGSRFSYIGMGSYNEPSRTGYPDTFQITNNGQTLEDVQLCFDEDPDAATYTSIAAQLVDTATAFNRTNGTVLKQWVYRTIQTASRWVGLEVTLPMLDRPDLIYEMFMAYKNLGGR